MSDIFEVCPYCGQGFFYPDKGYTETCNHCGKRIMLCDKCQNADDNPGCKCNWNEETGTCFRGSVK